MIILAGETLDVADDLARYAAGDDLDDARIAELRHRSPSSWWMQAVQGRIRVQQARIAASELYRAALRGRGRDAKSEKPRRLR